jgi:hypothetical protein
MESLCITKSKKVEQKLKETIQLCKSKYINVNISLNIYFPHCAETSIPFVRDIFKY